MKIINDWDIKEIENKIQVRRTGYYHEHMKFEVYLEDDELRSFSKYAKNLTEADILVKRIIKEVFISKQNLGGIEKYFIRKKYPSRDDWPCTNGVVTTMPVSKIKEALINNRKYVEDFYQVLDEVSV